MDDAVPRPVEREERGTRRREAGQRIHPTRGKLFRDRRGLACGTRQSSEAGRSRDAVFDRACCANQRKSRVPALVDRIGHHQHSVGDLRRRTRGRDHPSRRRQRDVVSACDEAAVLGRIAAQCRERDVAERTVRDHDPAMVRLDVAFHRGDDLAVERGTGHDSSLAGHSTEMTERVVEGPRGDGQHGGSRETSPVDSRRSHGPRVGRAGSQPVRNQGSIGRQQSPQGRDRRARRGVRRLDRARSDGVVYGIDFALELHDLAGNRLRARIRGSGGVLPVVEGKAARGELRVEPLAPREFRSQSAARRQRVVRRRDVAEGMSPRRIRGTERDGGDLGGPARRAGLPHGLELLPQ